VEKRPGEGMDRSNDNYSLNMQILYLSFSAYCNYINDCLGLLLNCLNQALMKKVLVHARLCTLNWPQKFRDRSSRSLSHIVEHLVMTITHEQAKELGDKFYSAFAAGFSSNSHAKTMRGLLASKVRNLSICVFESSTWSIARLMYSHPSLKGRHGLVRRPQRHQDTY
jgi:hypothetical protein